MIKLNNKSTCLFTFISENQRGEKTSADTVSFLFEEWRVFSLLQHSLNKVTQGWMRSCAKNVFAL